MRKFAHKILVLASIIAAMVLAMAYLSVYVNPKTYWFFSLLGLAYPVLLLINASFLIYWITRWKWAFIIPLVSILIGINHFSSFFQFPFGKQLEASSSDIKIMSYNVNLFHLYSWSKQPPTHDAIFSFIRHQKLDVVCIQEFYVADSKFSEQQARSITDYNVHIGYIVRRQTNAYGMATYSRYPIVGTGEIKFDNSANACIYTDLLVGADTIRVYNTHLQSLRLNQKNLKFINDLQSRKESKRMDEIKDISFRYRDALKKRAQQVEEVTGHIMSSPHPVIVCGDFNESPISYNYHRMNQNLNDAFVEAGSGVGHTYRAIFPSFRIDYILFTNHFKATSYFSPHESYSDHYPVITTLSYKQNALLE